MTRADVIRNMTDEELADYFLRSMVNACMMVFKSFKIHSTRLVKKEWLKKTFVEKREVMIAKMKQEVVMNDNSEETDELEL